MSREIAAAKEILQEERATFYEGLKQILLELNGEEWAYLKAWRDADTGLSKRLADKTWEQRLPTSHK